MSLYQIDVEKIVGTETWTNVYHAECDSQATAIAVANSVVTAERNLHTTFVTVLAHRVRLAGSGHVGVVTSVNAACLRANSGNMLPLFNCARVDFANGTARPARKYLRTGDGQSVLGTNFSWTAPMMTILNTYRDAILAIGNLRDPQGRTLTSGAPSALIAMHQLRRGNRRRPIL